MMRTFLLVLFCSLTFNLSAQNSDLVGTWEYVDEGFKRIAKIAEDYVFLEIYVDGTQIKMFDSYQYQSRRENKLVRSKYPLESNKEVTQLEIIELYKKKLIIKNISNGNVVEWKNVDHETPDISPINLNEYYFNGALGCTSSQANTSRNNCLNFKQINFEMSQDEIEKMLGKPYQQMTQNGQDYTIYLIPDQKEDQPYLVVSFNKGKKPTSLQLTGNTIGNDYAFSGIRLGDGGAYVRHRLGPPSAETKVSEELLMWNYTPFPISIEFKGGRVYSIRLESY